MEWLVEALEKLNLPDTNFEVKRFVKENEETFDTSELQEQPRLEFWQALFKHVKVGENDQLHCLKAIRILSREKASLIKVINVERLKKLIVFSNILNETDSVDECSIEALKCLCNITYNLPSVGEVLNNLEVTNALAKRLINFRNRKDLYDRKVLEIKLLFLVTAFSVPSRSMLLNQYHLSFFTDLCLEEGKIPKDNLLTSKREKISFDDNQLKILCDILKTAFTILMEVKTSDFKNLEKDLEEFISVLREITLVGFCPDTDPLIRDVVNVLTLIPGEFLDPLIIPGYKLPEKNVKCPSMEAISVLLDFLDATLIEIEEVVGTPKEDLSPILVVLTKLARSNKNLRKCIRSRVLPNLKEIYTRPEVGNTLRNKLCRLLTCPLTSTRDLVADFLFVLCKESVGRMVKYTGYGNAAGLFANRGLLAGDNGQHFSSESEDSETEEYSQHKHMINPIVGCLTPPRTDETSNMTEEQKEYLAMELVNKIDKLQREGIIQPCKIGPDGKPTPVEHLLELQDQPNLSSNV